MSPDLTSLIELQRIDTIIGEARRAVAAHPARLDAMDQRLSAATQAVQAAKDRLQACQDARRGLEKEAAVFQGRLSKYREQLPSVKTNREYQAMQKEIEVAEQELGSVEEKVLESMVEADGLAADVKAAESALAAERQDLEREKAALQEEFSRTTATLEAALRARADLIPGMSATAVALFEQVARVRKGIAVSEATRDGLCTECHVRLRPQVFQQVRQNDGIVQCDSCRRILYYVPPPPAPQADASAASPS
ncbi:MAG: zinc ribbon domain-containing protein [Vicinamibacterales bacterium]